MGHLKGDIILDFRFEIFLETAIYPVFCLNQTVLVSQLSAIQNPKLIDYLLRKTGLPPSLRDTVKAARISTNSVPTQPEETSGGVLLRIEITKRSQTLCNGSPGSNSSIT